MFLGGAPGGTAGGLKITTFFVLLVFARSELLGLPHANVARRTILPRTVQKSIQCLYYLLANFLAGLDPVRGNRRGESALYLHHVRDNFSSCYGRSNCKFDTRVRQISS